MFKVIFDEEICLKLVTDKLWYFSICIDISHINLLKVFNYEYHECMSQLMLLHEDRYDLWESTLGKMV